MKSKARITIALLLALSYASSYAPAYAKPRAATVHMRPQMFRDRAPKVRVRDGHTHEVKMKPPKSPPPPAPAKDEF